MFTKHFMMITTGYAVTAVLNVKHCSSHREYIHPETIVVKL